jgi:hypothetical protein
MEKPLNLSESFIDLGRKQAQLFRDNPEIFLECLIEYPSQRSVLFAIYNSLRMRGEIKTMEALPENERREIWNTAKELAKGRLPVDKMILLSKVLYTLNWLLEKQ